MQTRWDRIVVESVKVDSARRSGQILEVMEGLAGEHYRVHWDDGHESEFFPARMPRWFPLRPERRNT